MPINSTHKTYDAALPKWTRARDASSGQDAVHAKGVVYLPKLHEQTDIDYEAYKKRATYFNATGRTIDGLVGMIFRKPSEIEQTGIDGIVADIDLMGTSLNSFSQLIAREELTVGRIGVLVEYPRIESQVSTIAEAQRINLRPYASVYKTESIINWKYARINNVMQLTMVVLKECAYGGEDKYALDEIEQIRELVLENGIYIQRVYRKNSKSEFEQIEDDIIPLFNGSPLTFIPFYEFGSEINSLNIEDAPILSLADMNIAHYRVTADYEHGCHLSGLPTLLVAGITLGDNEKIYVGGSTAIVSNMPEAHGEYIEVKGNFCALRENLQDKKKEMAALGARLLEESKSGVESAEAMQIRGNGETSVLAAMANLISQQLSNMITFMSQWASVNSEVKVHLNTDFMPVAMTAQELTAIVGAWQAGAVSTETLFKNLKRGEIVSDDTSFQDEQDAIASQTPNLAQ